MTYERYKTGTFRVFVFLTVLVEALAFIVSDKGILSSSIEIFGIYFKHFGEVVFTLPIFVWGTYFFSLWIARGYIGKRKKFLEHYKDNLKDGMVTEWYPSGKKKSTSHYKNGIENGFRKEWNEDGKLTFQGNFVDGNEELK